MRIEDFVSDVTGRFPSRSGENQESRKVFIDDVYEIGEALGDSNRQPFIMKTKREWTKQGRPPIGLMWQWAQEIKPGAGQRDNSHYAYLCRNINPSGVECRTLLSENVNCPVCKQQGPEGKMGHVNFDVVQLNENSIRPLAAHEDCWMCDHWETQSRRYGPECDRWGKHDAGEMCRDCVCERCCAEKKYQKDNPAGFAQRIKIQAQKAGKHSTRNS